MDKKCSVIIITLNEERNIANLLSDLCEQTHKDFEVIIADSRSTDNTIRIAEKFSQKLGLSVIRMQERGTSLGRNAGAAKARYERLVFLDADDRIDADFLEKSLCALEKKGLWVAGGQICNNESLKLRLGVGIFNAAMLISQFFFPTCTGACIFSTKTTHEHIGGFDERIKLCEDCDYVKRASRTFRFRMLSVKFKFNARRLKQDGLFKMGFLYLRANIRRFFLGEMRNGEIEYPFAHYTSKPQ